MPMAQYVLQPGDTIGVAKIFSVHKQPKTLLPSGCIEILPLQSDLFEALQ